MNQVFINSDKQDRFDRNGFLVQPCLTGLLVSQLNQLFEATHPSPQHGFYSSSFSTDNEYLTQVSEGILKIVTPVLTKEFIDYRILGASFLVKYPGANGHMPIHQDWTIVDETKSYSMTMWIPLTQVSELNGAIRVLPGSHRFSNALRGPSLPNVFADVVDEIEKNQCTLHMNAGDGFIFNHALIHSSHLNHSNLPRVAIAVGLVPKESRLVFYHMESDEDMEKFEIPDDFFIQYKNIGRRPKVGKSLGLVPVEFNFSPKKNFLRMIENSNNTSSQKKTPQLLKSDSMQSKLDRDGYLTMPCLSADEVTQMREYYESTKVLPKGDYGFHITLDIDDSLLKSKIMNQIIKYLTPVVNRNFEDYQIFTASYVIKEPGMNTKVPPHQDWTVVDESQYASYTVWVALMDMKLANGAMCVLPGSHEFFNYPRVSPSPQSKAPLSDHYFTLFPYVKVLEMKAGEALVFNNKTIHASPPNTTAEARVAVGIGLTHKNAQLKHFYELPNTSPKLVRVYDIDNSFFMNTHNEALGQLFDANKEPAGLNAVDTIVRDIPEIDEQKLVAMIERIPGNKRNDALLESIGGFYGYDATREKQKKAQAARALGSLEHEPTDDRTFFQKYTLTNIIAEVNHRIKRKP
jgi:ectoine hydroxylase-related dioxygenase (phytanoyl-CoA dioxygenase family)